MCCIALWCIALHNIGLQSIVLRSLAWYYHAMYCLPLLEMTQLQYYTLPKSSPRVPEELRPISKNRVSLYRGDVPLLAFHPFFPLPLLQRKNRAAVGALPKQTSWPTAMPYNTPAVREGTRKPPGPPVAVARMRAKHFPRKRIIALSQATSAALPRRFWSAPGLGHGLLYGESRIVAVVLLVHALAQVSRVSGCPVAT